MTAVAELGYHIDDTHNTAPGPNQFCVCFSKLQNVDDLEQIWEQLSQLSADVTANTTDTNFAQKMKLSSRGFL